MNLLAVDTSGEPLSLALLAEGKVRRVRRAPRRPHDETLLPAVEALLQRAGLGFHDLGAIVAASGPGRFTGIRIGMAFTAVAAGRLGIPALAVSRLEALAWRASPGGSAKICAVLPGFRGERYYQEFGRTRAGLPRSKATPAWAAPSEWDAVRRSLESRGVALVEGDAAAEDLLAPARAALKLKRRPPFQPLYLKSAKYESAPRVLR